MLDLERESCPEILRQAAVLLERENRRLIEKTLKLQQENEALKGASPEELALKLQILEEQLSAVRRRLFAASSEKLPQDFPQESAPPSNAAPRKGHGRAEQPRLLVFLDDPRVPLDNNQAERALRGVASYRTFCTTFSKSRKHWGFIRGRTATRGSPPRPPICERRLNGFPFEIGRQNLPWRVGHDLVG